MGTVLLLGGSGGIGQEIICLLIERGYAIINVDRKEASIHSPLVTDIVVDLNEMNVTDIIKEILNKYNVDFFVSSIGYYSTRTIDDFNILDYNQTMTTNVTIPLLSALEVAREFSRKAMGKIVLISSAAAYVGSRDLGYSAAKAAVNGIVHGLVKNLENQSVYVYGIAPGIISTQMSDRMTNKRQNETIERTLNKRKGTAADVARVVRFLIDEDHGYMNGSIVHVNNGLYLN